MEQWALDDPKKLVEFAEQCGLSIGDIWEPGSTLLTRLLNLATGFDPIVQHAA